MISNGIKLGSSHMLNVLAVALLFFSGVDAFPAESEAGVASTPILSPRAGSAFQKQAVVVHPSAKHPMLLFHGTADAGNAASMAHGVDLSKTHTCGDLHHNQKHGSDGGAYFTDSLISAAQFACYRDAYDKTLKLPAVVHVLEYGWNPGNFKVFEFTEADKYKLSEAQCSTNDMVSGPMWNPFTDKSFTKNFWQYALVKQAAVKGLTYHRTYDVHCKHVPVGDALTDDMYTTGIGGNPHFNDLAKRLTAA